MQVQLIQHSTDQIRQESPRRREWGLDFPKVLQCQRGPIFAGLANSCYNFWLKFRLSIWQKTRDLRLRFPRARSIKQEEAVRPVYRLRPRVILHSRLKWFLAAFGISMNSQRGFKCVRASLNRPVLAHFLLSALRWSAGCSPQKRFDTRSKSWFSWTCPRRWSRDSTPSFRSFRA